MVDLWPTVSDEGGDGVGNCIAFEVVQKPGYGFLKIWLGKELHWERRSGVGRRKTYLFSQRGDVHLGT